MGYSNKEFDVLLIEKATGKVVMEMKSLKLGDVEIEKTRDKVDTDNESDSSN